MPVTRPTMTPLPGSEAGGWWESTPASQVELCKWHGLVDEKGVDLLWPAADPTSSPHYGGSTF